VTPKQLKKLDRELSEFVDSLVAGMGRPERRAAMGLYVTGLLIDGERKSIEPIASRLVDDPAKIEGMRQRLQQAVVVARWDAAEMFGRIALKAERELPKLEAFVIDDTGFAKKGAHSVGVARQYSGTLGRIDNCQVATSLHLAGERGSCCVSLRLYLPEEWASNLERRQKAQVPDELQFREKWRIALELLDEALERGVRKRVVLADAGYGSITEFRNELRERELPYLVAVPGALAVWSPDTVLKPPRATSNMGRPPTRPRIVSGEAMPISELASTLSYRRVTWREGSKGKQSSRFAAVRLRTAHKHSVGRSPGPEEWLLCEWPADRDAPSKFYLSSMPANTSVKELVRLAKLRWRIERDYQEMKGELGLDHFEGRTWDGFHHHAALCAAAHAFLAIRRAVFPPEQSSLDLVARPKDAPAGLAL
jgi:SRSO17 transposase